MIKLNHLKIFPKDKPPGEWVPKAPSASLHLIQDIQVVEQKEKTKGTFRVGALIKPTQIDARHRAIYALTG